MGICIWNDNNNTCIGLYDYVNTTRDATVKFTLQGYNYMGGEHTMSAYNYTTKKLSFVAIKVGTTERSLFTISTETWTQLNALVIPDKNTWEGLQYDQTDRADSLLNAGNNGQGTIFLTRLNPMVTSFSIFGSIVGSLLSAAYDTKSFKYHVAYKHGEDVFINIYNMAANPVALESSQKYSFTNIASRFSYASGPNHMYHHPKYNSIMGIVSLRDSHLPNPHNSVLTNITAANKEIRITGMNSDPRHVVTACVPDQTGAGYIYTITKFSDKLYCNTFSPYNNTCTKNVLINTPILALF
ncbi:hypothetical protein CYY_007299 [Polysphondylium violaceum]|uniref:Uncharacterized protein n=1 Tax=Polysphondylium violaceum TaxID=133409 RepID=A0A8J4UY37_9MYCE|nr:hypothetical protein CYY_007299 [Polysphondylium violaceum]